jgi:ATP-dependent Lon protease
MRNKDKDTSANITLDVNEKKTDDENDESDTNECENESDMERDDGDGDGDGDGDDDEECEDDDDEEAEIELDPLEYKRLLASLFPSAYMIKQIQEQEKEQKQSQQKCKSNKKSQLVKEMDDKQGKSTKDKKKDNKHKIENENTTQTRISKTKTKNKSIPQPTFEKPKKKNQSPSKIKKSTQPPSKRRRRHSDSSRESDYKKQKEVEDENDEDEENDTDDDDDNDVVDDDETNNVSNKKLSHFNIILNLQGPDEDEEDDDYEDEDDEDEDEDEDDEVESDESDSTEDKNNATHKEEEMHKENNGTLKTRKEKKKEAEEKQQTEQMKKDKDALDIDLKAIEKLRIIIDDLKKEGASFLMDGLKQQLKTAEKNYNKKLKEQTKKEKASNTKKFVELLRQKNMMNDVKFFREKMSIDDQQRILQEMERVKMYYRIDKPYKLTLLEADIPPEYKAIAYKKINMLKEMEPNGGEYYKLKQWIDTFMCIPFGKYKNLPVTLQADGVQKCGEFMNYAKKTLDEAVYGMNDVKLQIIQIVGQWITNPKAMGTAIAIRGPMGTGKTTIVKDGISKILGRDFAFIALGGATDSSFLEGHSYTYEGSTWGKIIDILVQSDSMNPVIFLDELDKVSDTPKGEEIIGILTHLTDTTQNHKFHDKYFAELDFDLSRALFIFSYNDEHKVNPILRDRMYRVDTKGYSHKDKIIIANQYLLPKIREQVCIQKDEICIPDDQMYYIIQNYTENEDGVRNLKRCLEMIYTKLNLYRLMVPGTNLFGHEMTISTTFPITLTNEMVDKLLKQDKSGDGHWKTMYM